MELKMSEWFHEASILVYIYRWKYVDMCLLDNVKCTLTEVCGQKNLKAPGLSNNDKSHQIFRFSCCILKRLFNFPGMF